jgi:hypothetical protein
LALNLQTYQKFEGGIFNLREPTDLDVRRPYHTKFSNRFETLENLSYNEEIDRSLKNLKEKTETSATASLGLCELQQHTLFF